MSVIAIVGGTGPEGTGLASRWARAGESIILGSRQADRARDVAERLRQTLGSGVAIEGDENSAAVARAEIVVLTIPFSAHAETLKNLKSAFRPAAVLIDTTVPLASSVGGRATQLLGVWQGSAAQQAAELVPKGVVVDPAYQRRGVGRALVRALLTLESGPVLLMCAGWLTPYYQGFGFQVVPARTAPFGLFWRWAVVALLGHVWRSQAGTVIMRRPASPLP